MKKSATVKAWLIRTGEPWDQDNLPRAVVFKEVDKILLLQHYGKLEVNTFAEECTATVKGERDGHLLLSVEKPSTHV